jgi:hypothetical protein
MKSETRFRENKRRYVIERSRIGKNRPDISFN